MITQNNIKYLEKIVSHYAMQDFKRANPHPKRLTSGRTNYKPYSLSDKTCEARYIYSLARKKTITPEEEKAIKAYILKHKLLSDI